MNKSKGCTITSIPAFECDQLECLNPLLFCEIGAMTRGSKNLMSHLNELSIA